MPYSILCNKPKTMRDTYLLYGEYQNLTEAERGKLDLQNQARKNQNSSDFDIILVCEDGTEIGGYVWKKQSNKTDEFWSGKWEPNEE